MEKLEIVKRALGKLVHSRIITHPPIQWGANVAVHGEDIVGVILYLPINFFGTRLAFNPESGDIYVHGKKIFSKYEYLEVGGAIIEVQPKIVRTLLPGIRVISRE